MAAFPLVAPRKAISIVESAGVPDAARAILDFAAAGQVRARAIVIETVAFGGERQEDHGPISPELWKRAVRELSDHDVWLGGTLRLAGGDQVGAAPEVSITGTRFEVMDLHRLILYHRGNVAAAESKATEPAADAKQAEATNRRHRRVADSSLIPPGALLATVNQAMATLGLGRTKVNKLMNSGKLVRRHIDGGVRIEAASIRALARARAGADC